ncbi:hypothetical protein AMTR_s00016p00192470 [Amborella trichopoda]|uniref:Uncharacterized protein n=1 Tax=Amborella trichopoda TaxID=13333 RepID=W1PGN1_AMBTC|nr:hypothetical protein AMTR_s00016p00192470 [Amborella trichopoda]
MLCTLLNSFCSLNWIQERLSHQLSTIHPELLLFLSKIKQLSVLEANTLSENATVSGISISRETEYETRNDIDAESYVLYLSAHEHNEKVRTECTYYMWKQRFPVKSENRVEGRKEIEELVISLAFPHGERLKRGTSSARVYAFLSTEMITNFPFIIQADFLLSPSTETIISNNKWNHGFLNCFPMAFNFAFSSLLKSIEESPRSTIATVLDFLPIRASPFPELNIVRKTIRDELVKEHIIPCESFSEKRAFGRPIEVGRLVPFVRSL